MSDNIAHPFSYFSWNASCSIFFMSLKGLYYFWSNFFESYFNWIFFASSYTLFSCINYQGFCLFLLNCSFITSFDFSMDDFTFSQLLCSSLRKVSSFGNSVFIVKSSFYKCLSKLSLTGIYPVVEYFLSLYWNFTGNNYFVQLSC